MNILVCMKAVPSTSQVQVDGQFRLQRNGISLQWNIADESALEAALQLKGPDDHVTVLTMGPKKLEDSLKDLLTRGVDRAVLLTDPLMAGADTIATARALAAVVIKLGGFDLILCGRRALDGETGQVPPMLAAALSIPCVTNVERIELCDDCVNLHRRLEHGISHLVSRVPLCVSLCEYTYPLRLPGIMGMRKARQKTVECLTSQDLSLSPDDCGLKGSLTKVIAMDTKFPGLRKGPKETDISQCAAHILSVLREVVP